VIADSAEAKIGAAAARTKTTVRSPVHAPSVAWCDARLSASLQHRVHGDNAALIENTDHVGELLHLDDTACSVRNALIVAADRDEAVVAHAALEL
jgi:hypothetical protein